jgi:hypothetical protein
MTKDRKHNHYFKDVSNLNTIDVYRVLHLFNVTDPCIQHAVKKLLVAGGRGAGKDITKDVKEAVDSLNRWTEMRGEEVPTVATLMAETLGPVHIIQRPERIETGAQLAFQKLFDKGIVHSYLPKVVLQDIVAPEIIPKGVKLCDVAVHAYALEGEPAICIRLAYLPSGRVFNSTKLNTLAANLEMALTMLGTELENSKGRDSLQP